MLMEKTKDFIVQNKESFELYANFEDYEVLFKAIENKTTSDHSIEACKALLEGISKTIIGQVDLRYKGVEDRFTEQERRNLKTVKTKIERNNTDFHELVQHAIVVLAAFHHACEKDFLLGFSNKFFTTVAKLRDRRGDVAHGREAPKFDKSSLTLAEMIESITDVIAFHMLEVFSLIDFSIDKIPDTNVWIEEAFMIKPASDLENLDVRERQIRDFNAQLDEENHIGDGMSYSLALYQQRKEEYLILLNDYDLEQEEKKKAETA